MDKSQFKTIKTIGLGAFGEVKYSEEISYSLNLMKHLILVLFVDIQKPGDSCAKTRSSAAAVVRHEDPEEGWSAQKESGDNKFTLIFVNLNVNYLPLDAKIVNSDIPDLDFLLL